MKIYFDAHSRKPNVSVGNQAFIISGLQILQKKFINCEFVFLVADIELEKYYLKDLPFKINMIKRNPSQLGTIKQIRKILNDVDVVVSSWGDGYITFPPSSIFRKTLFLRKKGVPMVLFTSSIGHLGNGLKASIAKKGISYFDVATVRDAVTYENLTSVGLKNIKFVHDSAFVLEPSSDEVVDKILKDVGVPKGSKFIGLNISVLMYHLFSKSGKSYVDSSIDLINWLKSKYNLPVVLIPHQIYMSVYKYSQGKYESKGGDDRFAIQKIEEKLSSADGIYMLKGEYGSKELKGVIKRAEIFIGGRMHSIVGATSMCVPSLIFKYSHKAEGMFKSLGMPEYVWDINDSQEALKEKIDLLWTNKKKVKSYLNDIMPDIKQKIYGLADIVDELLPN